MKFKILLIAFVMTVTPLVTNSQTKKLPDDAAIRSHWYSRVSEAAFKAGKYNASVDEKDTQTIMKGIPILLSFEFDQSEASFCAATSPEMDPPTQECTVEVAALFYISYIFYGKDWDYFAGGIALVENGKINSPETIAKAYASYKKWFKKVQKIGLEEARKQDLDPLGDTGIGWYGGRKKE